MKGFQSQRKTKTWFSGVKGSSEMVKTDRSNQIGNDQYFNQIEFTCSKYISDREQPVILNTQRTDGQKTCESCLKWQEWAERAQNSMLKIEKDLIQKEKRLRALIISLKNQLAVEKEKNFLRTYPDISVSSEKMKKRKSQLSLNFNKVSESYRPDCICFSPSGITEIQHNVSTCKKQIIFQSVTKNDEKWNLKEINSYQCEQEPSENCMRIETKKKESNFQECLLSNNLFHGGNQISNVAKTQSSRYTLMDQKKSQNLLNFVDKFDRLGNLMTNQSQINQNLLNSEKYQEKEEKNKEKKYTAPDRKNGGDMMKCISNNSANSFAMRQKKGEKPEQDQFLLKVEESQDQHRTKILLDNFNCLTNKKDCQDLSSIQVSKRDSRKNSSKSSIDEVEKKQVSVQTIKKQGTEDSYYHLEPKFQDKYDSKQTLKHMENKTYKKRLSKSYLPVETQKYEADFDDSCNQKRRMKKNSVKYDCVVRYDSRLQKSHTHQTLTDCSYLVGQENVTHQIRLNHQENDQASKNARKENNNPERLSQIRDGDKDSEDRKNMLLEKLSFENENLKAYNKVLLEKLSNSRPRKY